MTLKPNYSLCAVLTKDIIGTNYTIIILKFAYLSSDYSFTFIYLKQTIIFVLKHIIQHWLCHIIFFVHSVNVTF